MRVPRQFYGSSLRRHQHLPLRNRISANRSASSGSTGRSRSLPSSDSRHALYGRQQRYCRAVPGRSASGRGTRQLPDPYRTNDQARSVPDAASEHVDWQPHLQHGTGTPVRASATRIGRDGSCLQPRLRRPGEPDADRPIEPSLTPAILPDLGRRRRMSRTSWSRRWTALQALTTLTRVPPISRGSRELADNWVLSGVQAVAHGTQLRGRRLGLGWQRFLCRHERSHEWCDDPAGHRRVVADRVGTPNTDPGWLHLRPRQILRPRHEQRVRLYRHQPAGRALPRRAVTLHRSGQFLAMSRWTPGRSPNDAAGTTNFGWPPSPRCCWATQTNHGNDQSVTLNRSATATSGATRSAVPLRAEASLWNGAGAAVSRATSFAATA